MPILEQEPCLFPGTLLCQEPDTECSRKWWAIYTKARQEKALARDLMARHVPFFLPLVPKENLIRGRKTRSWSPLFQGYVFLYGTDEERVVSLTTNRISRILPVFEPDQLRRDLHQVHQLIERDAPLTPERKLASGNKVRIKRGLLAGLEGTVIKRHGQNRLLVAVNYLQQGVSVQIDDFLVEAM